MKKTFFGLLILALISSACQTKTETKRKFGEVIFDSAKLLKPDQAESLYSSIISIEKEFGSQLAIVIVDSVRGKTIEEYSLQTAERLNLGRDKYRDGLLMVLAIGQQKGKTEVGYGLERIITDEISGRITREQMLPHFREGDFYGGFLAAVQKIHEHIKENPQLIGKSLRDK